MNEQAAQMAAYFERKAESRSSIGVYLLAHEVQVVVTALCLLAQQPAPDPAVLMSDLSDIRRFVTALHDQLQQERKGREKLRAALGAIEREAIVQYMSAFNHGPAAETIVKLARAALAQTAATPDSGGRL